MTRRTASRKSSPPPSSSPSSRLSSTDWFLWCIALTYCCATFSYYIQFKGLNGADDGLAPFRYDYNAYDIRNGTAVVISPDKTYTPSVSSKIGVPSVEAVEENAFFGEGLLTEVHNLFISKKQRTENDRLKRTAAALRDASAFAKIDAKYSPSSWRSPFSSSLATPSLFFQFSQNLLSRIREAFRSRHGPGAEGEGFTFLNLSQVGQRLGIGSDQWLLLLLQSAFLTASVMLVWRRARRCLLLHLYLLCVYTTMQSKVGQTFLNFQWDILLMEVGLVGCMVALATSAASAREAVASFLYGRSPLRHSLSICLIDGALTRSARTPMFLLRVVAFKLMFMSGATKVLSGCETWETLSATQYHYATQCLPNPIAWYFHNYLTPFDQRVSVAVTLASQIAVSITMLLPTPSVGAALVHIVSQAMIILTGNYGFFNWFSIFICAEGIFSLLSIPNRSLISAHGKKEKSGRLLALLTNYRVMITILTTAYAFGMLAYTMSVYFTFTSQSVATTSAEIPSLHVVHRTIRTKFSMSEFKIVFAESVLPFCVISIALCTALVVVSDVRAMLRDVWFLAQLRKGPSVESGRIRLRRSLLLVSTVVVQVPLRLLCVAAAVSLICVNVDVFLKHTLPPEDWYKNNQRYYREAALFSSSRSGSSADGSVGGAFAKGGVTLWETLLGESAIYGERKLSRMHNIKTKMGHNSGAAALLVQDWAIYKKTIGAIRSMVASTEWVEEQYDDVVLENDNPKGLGGKFVKVIKKKRFVLEGLFAMELLRFVSPYGLFRRMTGVGAPISPSVLTSTDEHASVGSNPNTNARGTSALELKRESLLRARRRAEDTMVLFENCSYAGRTPTSLLPTAQTRSNTRHSARTSLTSLFEFSSPVYDDVAIVERPEVTIEGSDTPENASSWRPYHFLYKPSGLSERPPVVAPHQPRLDWQMWFAALSSGNPPLWLIHLIYKLLTMRSFSSSKLESCFEPSRGCETPTAMLMAHRSLQPFSSCSPNASPKPPRAIRLVLRKMDFSTIGESHVVSWAIEDASRLNETKESHKARVGGRGADPLKNTAKGGDMPNQKRTAPALTVRRGQMEYGTWWVSTLPELYVNMHFSLDDPRLMKVAETNGWTKGAVDHSAQSSGRHLWVSQMRKPLARDTARVLLSVLSSRIFSWMDSVFFLVFGEQTSVRDHLLTSMCGVPHEYQQQQQVQIHQDIECIAESIVSTAERVEKWSDDSWHFTSVYSRPIASLFFTFVVIYWIRSAIAIIKKVLCSLDL